MEYLDGLDLETLVQTCGPQPWQRVVHIMRQVSGSLEEAHECGLIHRDIKPSNIILCRRGCIPDVAKVLDFGLVKEIDRADGLTKANAVTGTPAYLPPEAVIRPAEVSAASDLYALGAVGYFLVTGELVFSGETPVEICMKHVDSVPVPPSQRGASKLPKRFEELLLQCLSKAQDERPKSARDLRIALDEIAREGEWPEAEANEWWQDFRRSHVDAAAKARPSSLATMTVDVGSRTDLEMVLGTDAEVDSFRGN
jgi:serine/threonine protein kinase